MPSFIYKKYAFELTKPLTKIIILSITEQTFPKEWKYAEVMPIYKNKGTKKDPDSKSWTSSSMLVKLNLFYVAQYIKDDKPQTFILVVLQAVSQLQRKPRFPESRLTATYPGPPT